MTPAVRAAAAFASSLAAAACLCAAAAPREHAIFDSVPLDGEWEMAYAPSAPVKPDPPRFKGVRIARAVPGFWEDMVPAFRAAGMDCSAFRQNPYLTVQKLPLSGQAEDTTIPGIMGCFFYRRTVALDRTGTATVRFAGVRNRVRMWVNGAYAASHAGFSTPFELPVPSGLLKKGTNEIVLAVDNDPVQGFCAPVSGLSTRGLFRATGGIDGSVELRFPRNGIGDIHVTTAADLSSFTVHVSGAGGKPFGWTVSRGGKVVAKGSAKGDFTVPSKGFEFWSPESPALYDLEISTRQGSAKRRFGIRRLTAKGEGFLLNGRPVYLRGVTDHCYFPETVHIPRDLGYYRKAMARRRELGFNFVRTHTFAPPDEYLQAADEAGVMVHVESPNFTTEAEFAAIVAASRGHPSAVAYCAGNEYRIDRLVEAYLSDVASIVHSMSDALFTPMSAMRGVESCLAGGKDPVVRRPFAHNAQRMARLARYSDYFTSYQLGATSYNSLDGPGTGTLRARRDAYCGKPRTSHEICIDGGFIDLETEKLYPPGSPVVAAGIFSEPRRVLAEKGLLGRAPAYARNSAEWMRRIRKHCFEKVRSSARTAGYDFLGDADCHWHTFGYCVGMMDEFFRLKPGETVENVLRYNSPAVILCSLGSDFNFAAGTEKSVTFRISNYAADAKGAFLDLSLADAASGATVWSGRLGPFDAPAGRITRIGSAAVKFPASAMPAKYLLRASLSGAQTKAANEWETYAFPPAAAEPAPAGVTVAASMDKKSLLAAMERGDRVLLLGPGPFKSLKTTFRIGLAGRCSGNYATVIKAGHPALAGFPHEGFCGWQFRRLLEGARAVQLEAGVPFDPVIDVAASDKFPVKQSVLFEYKAGKGRLLVCPLAFGENDPAARWLKAQLVRYAASPEFKPAHSVSTAQLAAAIDAPLKSGDRDANRARNPNDPASEVRAGAFARP